jgi:PAS domain S-box-containing protein
MHGFTIDELKGKPIIDLFAPDKRGEIDGKIELANKTGHLVWESEHLRKDGSVFPVRMDVTPVKDDKGKILYRVVNVQDITERKIAENALKQSEEKFKLLLNSAAEAIYGLDMNGNCTFCNKAAIEILGLGSEEDVLGKNMHDIIHYAHADGSSYHMQECKVYQAFQEKKGTHIDDEVLWRMDGTPFPAEYWSYPMYRDNEVIGAVVTFIDITERKNVESQLQQYNEKLEEMNRTKDRFFTIIAHDLKSPFIGLLGYSNILANEYDTLSEDEKTTFIRSIDELGQNTYKLLENLLEWARLQTGKMTFAPEKFNLLLELHPTLNIVKQTALNKNIEFTYEIDNSIFINADKNMLLTIIRNLISNAIKFTNPGGKITLTSLSKPGKTEFTVTDNGVGIEEKNLSEIFKVAKGKTTPGTANESGTGLGLLLCKEMVEKHGGKIKVESEAGRGTTFSFTIPL